MTSKDRQRFFSFYAFGITALVVVYMLLTAFRDLRDNYMAEIWIDLGYGNSSIIFTSTEIPVALLVLFIIGSTYWMKDNFKALMVNHFLILFGLLLMGFSFWLFRHNYIDAPAWMTLVGMGLYLGYIPFNCIIFDRLVSLYNDSANAGFPIYIADAFGYIAAVAMLLVKNYLSPTINWYQFFVNTSYNVVIYGILLTLISMNYFMYKRWISKSSQSESPAYF